MEGRDLRSTLAKQASEMKQNKDKCEKTIEVNNEVFEKCLSGMNEHHKNFHRKRGFIRTYTDPFWTDLGDQGQHYNHGIVYIIDRQNPNNTTYTLNSTYSNFEKDLAYAIKHLNHRLISMNVSYEDDNAIVATLSRQRSVFE